MVHRPASRGVVLTLAGIIVALLVVLPIVLAASEGSSGPAFGMMDQLAVPAWASQAPHDATIGSRWCIGECQVSERDASSTHPVATTESAYVDQLRAAGWTPAATSACTSKVAGSYTCWLFDQHELDLWVRPSTCTAPPPPATETGIPDPTLSAPPKSGSCVPTSVQIKVFDKIERAQVQGAT